MKAPASGRISAAKTGWIIALLMLGWALFLILPFGRKEEVAAPKIPVERPGEAALAAVGLPYNVDWIGLPEYFAVWAEQAGWEDDRTKFAYWNPMTESYSYFFEAIRVQGRYRFHPIMRADLERKPAFYYDEEHEALSEKVPEPKSESTTHPFIFLSTRRGPATLPILPEPGTKSPLASPPAENAPKVEVEINPTPLKVPEPVLQTTVH